VPPIINVQSVSKTYGTAPLFKNVSLTVSEGARIGLIGPNGSGKSTLLQILYGAVKPDTGEIAVRKRARLSHIAQASTFTPGETVRHVIESAINRTAIPVEMRQSRMAEILGRAGFKDLDAEATTLSGGWQKRLAIVEGLVQEPDILLLDEPTNHLDLAGIEWLETLLKMAPFASIVVSHDRYLLENFATEIVELNRIYTDGLLHVDGNYSNFLQAKEDYLHAQGKRQESLENRVHTELEWLRRGAKARTRKSKARIDKAFEIMAESADLNERSQTATAGIEFAATDRRTKQLIELEGVGYSIGGRTLFQDLDFTVKAGMRIGIVGPNGSGKTTLLRLIEGEIQPTSGSIRRADQLKLVHFDQGREIDSTLTLRRALAPDSDSVVYQDRVIHVAAWASRFLFDPDDLNQPVARLSGGERARVLIAQLMLRQADVLLLDEPTNDLDIPTLEVLEDSLQDYRGALVLVTHDRYMMDRISNVVLGLDGFGDVARLADYSQWTEWQRAQALKRAPNVVTDTRSPRPAAEVVSSPVTAKKKMSYKDAREHASVESRLADAEDQLRIKQAALEDPAIMSDALRLQAAIAALEQAQKDVELLYGRWAELEEKR